MEKCKGGGSLKFNKKIALFVVVVLIVGVFYFLDIEKRNAIVSGVQSLGKSSDEKAIQNLYVFYETLSETESVFYNTMEPIHELEALEAILLRQMFEYDESQAAELKTKKEQAISFASERANKINMSSEDMLKALGGLNAMKEQSESVHESELAGVLSSLLSLTEERKELFEKMINEYAGATADDITMYEKAGSFDYSTLEIKEAMQVVQLRYEKLGVLQDEVDNNTKLFLESKAKFYDFIGKERKK